MSRWRRSDPWPARLQWMTARARRVGITVATLLLGACASRELPTVHYYSLSSTGAPAAASETPSDGLRVGVERFAVDPPYDQDRLVYRPGGDSSEVGFYHYHRWASPLGRMAARAVTEGLRGTAGIADIEPAAHDGVYTARLAGRVMRLEEVDTAAAQTIHVRLRLTLSDVVSGEVLWNGTLEASREIDAESVSEVVAAAREALDDVVSQARRGIVATLR